MHLRLANLHIEGHGGGDGQRRGQEHAHAEIAAGAVAAVGVAALDEVAGRAQEVSRARPRDGVSDLDTHARGRLAGAIRRLNVLVAVAVGARANVALQSRA